MHINLHAAVFNIELLPYEFNNSRGLNLNFEIESAHKLVMNSNLNVDFQKSITLNLDFAKSMKLDLNSFVSRAMNLNFKK